MLPIPLTHLNTFALMNQNELTDLSKLLSFVLRHNPQHAKVEPDNAGWVSIEELIAGLNSRGKNITRDQIETVVAESDKQRFSISEDGLNIRCNQGHSIYVELGYEPKVPPEILFHGTATRFVDSIKSSGLKREQRHHVHLSADAATAEKVGVRHGKLALLQVRAGEMHGRGFEFFLSDNGVWLTQRVPPEFIVFPPEL